MYNDIAKVPAYERAGLSYEDLCKFRLFESDPELGYGFWGHCLNQYRDTKPHEGYAILSKWCQNRESYVYTSNVDGHFLRCGFDPEFLCEIHGRVDNWMPLKDNDEIALDSTNDSGQAAWFTLPDNFR